MRFLLFFVTFCVFSLYFLPPKALALDKEISESLPKDTETPSAQDETALASSTLFDLNAIAAVVEDQIITHNEIYQEMLPLLKQVQYESLSAEDYEQRLKAVEADVRQSLIDRVLIVKEFEKQGFQIPDPIFEAEFNHHIEKAFGNDRTLFLQYLKAQGKDLKQFRKEFKDKLIVSAMRGKKQSSQSEISPDKIEAYYQQHAQDFYQDEQLYLLQILFSPEASESQKDLLARAKAVLDRSKTEDFSSFYKTYSSSSDLGWVSKGDLISDLSEKVFTLAKGSCSEPIVLNDTVFLFYVKDQKAAGIQPLDAVREEIELILNTQLMRKNIEQWLKGLRKRAYIKLYP